ncbi:aminotransferase class I/II-fold pyridoxal phosphate-dependent enzyme [Salinibacterium sp. UTAS2018]|uniref:MalY/PatB family protein n=1 Tax=Salinibacterium sp. UTAS2018 TaxID=2508880 RepID=UPI00100946B8|nr:aminotransferase class I/II-fold pyridoxal phosphate-dependent enzyme [Salinibacterium sp. UTAS2018]QAV71398.1 aminotransferase class I/II-fold pyridoxal phosphate-dependent enzyme [Salinibacterium sp. UTAS2018]
MTTNAEQWNALTPELLRSRGSNKWTAPEGDLLCAGVAEMDYGTAPAVLEEWAAVAERFGFGYPDESVGLEMNAATAQWHREQYGWQLDAADVHPLPDVLKGLELAITKFSKPGAAVVVPTPAYMPFLAVPKDFGREVIESPMLRGDDGSFALDLDDIARHFAAGANLLILANPGNPTGKVYSRDELVALAEVADAHGARIFSDEIHSPLALFGNKHVPLASVSDAGARAAITATSTSKAFNLPGMKCAQIILSNDADRAQWESLSWLATHGASTPGMKLNTAAYLRGEPWLLEVREYIEGNIEYARTALAELLPEARMAPMQGTYLAWLDLRAYSDEPELSEMLAEKAGIRVNGGVGYGAVGAGHIRVNLATSRPILARIIAQLAAALKA